MNFSRFGRTLKQSKKTVYTFMCVCVYVCVGVRLSDVCNVRIYVYKNLPKRAKLEAHLYT